MLILMIYSEIRGSEFKLYLVNALNHIYVLYLQYDIHRQSFYLLQFSKESPAHLCDGNSNKEINVHQNWVYVYIMKCTDSAVDVHLLELWHLTRLISDLYVVLQ